MDEVYQKCAQTLKPGGYLALITKDQTRDGERVYHSLNHQKGCIRAGLMPYEWFKRQHIGEMFGLLNRRLGVNVIDDEDMIIMKKPI